MRFHFMAYFSILKNNTSVDIFLPTLPLIGVFVTRLLSMYYFSASAHLVKLCECVCGWVIRCVFTVVWGVGLLLLGIAGVTEGQISSGTSPLLSKTLEREIVKGWLTAPCSLITARRLRKRDRSIIHHRRRTLPWVCGPTEHLTAVFEDVLVAVRVLDSVLSRPGTFNLSKKNNKNEFSFFNGKTNFLKNQLKSIRKVMSLLFKSRPLFLDVIPTGLLWPTNRYVVIPGLT